MKLVIHRYRLEIRPEGETDEAYIEEVLGLKEQGAAIELVRENCAGVSSLLRLVTRTPKQKALAEEPPA